MKGWHRVGLKGVKNSVVGLLWRDQMRKEGEHGRVVGVVDVCKVRR